MLGNLATTLLQAGAAGVIAPGVEVDSQAAGRAAKTFYEAVKNDETTVAEAVQRVRALSDAGGVTAEQQATYLSYFAFVPASMKLNFG